MYTAGAYLHWYEKYAGGRGESQAYFAEGVERVAGIVEEYRWMGR